MITFSDVKNYLNITYEDEDINTKLSGILSRADSHVRKVSAVKNENELTPDEEQLVLDCCRYIFNDAFEDFDRNFMPVINGCRGARQVAELESDNNAG